MVLLMRRLNELHRFFDWNGYGHATIKVSEQTLSLLCSPYELPVMTNGLKISPLIESIKAPNIEFSWRRLNIFFRLT